MTSSAPRWKNILMARPIRPVWNYWPGRVSWGTALASRRWQNAMTFPLILALALNGMLAGMTVDQSVKQLPARRTIGAAAFSRYSRAADLKNGVPLYAFFGLGAPASCLWLAFSAVQRSGWDTSVSIAALASVLFSLGQLATTAFAAPTNFSQRRHALSEEAALTW